MDYIGSWASVARELQRIARVPPSSYDSNTSGIAKAREDTSSLISNISWDKVFDFCERIYSHLAQDVYVYIGSDEREVSMTRAAVQAHIETELQCLFAEDHLAYEFNRGSVTRQGKRHSVELASKAQLVMGDPKLQNARRHYDKALQFFRNIKNPDYENCVKDAVCAVEAAGKSIFPNAKAATLGDLSNWLKKTSDVEMPLALTKIIDGIYGYRSGGDGIGHGGSAGGTATSEVAELVLAVSATLIIYFVDLDNSQGADVPF
jgi:hypothetical protein